MRIRRSGLWLVLATAAGLLSACEAADPVILKLDGTELRRSEFTKYLASVEARGRGPARGRRRARGLLDSFLEDRALVIEATAHGLVGARGARRRGAPGGRAPAGRRGQAPAPSEAEIRAYYGEHEAELAGRARGAAADPGRDAQRGARRQAQARRGSPKAFDKPVSICAAPLSRRGCRERERGRAASMGAYRQPRRLPAELESPRGLALREWLLFSPSELLLESPF
jgi:hypothetical protein